MKARAQQTLANVDEPHGAVSRSGARRLRPRGSRGIRANAKSQLPPPEGLGADPSASTSSTRHTKLPAAELLRFSKIRLPDVFRGRRTAFAVPAHDKPVAVVDGKRMGIFFERPKKEMPMTGKDDRIPEDVLKAFEQAAKALMLGTALVAMSPP
jgi:hypothetical protein